MLSIAFVALIGMASEAWLRQCIHNARTRPIDSVAQGRLSRWHGGLERVGLRV